MSNKKEISIDNLEDITGGSGQQRDEILSFIKKYYPDVKTSSVKELKKFMESQGIVNVVYHPNCPNLYYDSEGNELTHEQFMQLLKDNLVEK